ncbi:MAG: peptidylprolyl isomerase [Sedimentisphaerales bacterium]|nr:peptidylprolyl isomerase [Sedimentisphaerales bacterium]
MRISSKVVLLMVCVLAGTVFYQGCKKPAKEKVSAEGTKEAKEAVKKTDTAQVAEKKEVKEAVAPAVVPSAAKPAAGTSEGKDVAVTVNGSDITEREVDVRIKPHLDRIARQMDPNMAGQYKKRIRGQALEMMITERLLDEQVKKANITVTDGDVNDRISEIIAQQGMSMDGFKAMLQMQGQDFEQLKQQMKQGLAYEKFMDRQVGAMEVNDADALAYYEENKADYNTPEEVKTSHILIKVAPSASTEEKAQAKEKAEKLLKQVKEGGDFAALAMENSDCPSKAKGGDLGFFERGTMVKEFADAAFAMQVGQVSDIVETQFGYHIIKVTDRKQAGLTPFEKAKPDIVKTLEQTRKNRLYKQYIDKLKMEAKIVYPPGKDPKEFMLSRPMEIAPAPK